MADFIARISGVSNGGHMTAVAPMPAVHAQLITERPPIPPRDPPASCAGLMRRCGLTEMPPPGKLFKLTEVNAAIKNAGFRMDEGISLKVALHAAGLL